MVIKKQEHLFFFLLFGAAMVLFLWKLIAMQGLFIRGDNLFQFYPWFKVYASALKSLRFPFWVREMQSGFPLMAEGQVGGYYPLNILFFLFLPFHVAYNYSVVFHFAVAGVSIYFLARRLGACEWGGILSALILCFGSSFAGCFYNIITLRTLSWTPLVFLLFEYYFDTSAEFSINPERSRRVDKKRLSYLVTAGVIFGSQLLAGFAQAAFYSGFFYLLYFIYKVRLDNKDLVKNTANFALFSIIAAAIFLPQFVLTFKLVSHSVRPEADLGFALWGSFNPLGIIAAVFPAWAAFTRNDLYVSVFGILFLIASFSLLKEDKRLRPIFLILVVSLLLAIGRHNPVYVALLKVTKLYFLRNPSKMLFFAILSAAVLIGRSFSSLFNMTEVRRIKVVKIYSSLLLFSGFIFLISKSVLSVFKDQIFALGRAYVEKNVHGSSHHIYDMHLYAEKIDSFYRLMLDGTSLSNIFNIISLFLIGAGLLASALIVKKRIVGLKNAIFIIMIIDLYIYSFIGTGFRGNVCGFDRLEPTHKKILEYIKSDKDLFRVLPYDIASKGLPFWIMPNANISYNIDSVASYSPLANRYYKEETLPLEIVNTSLGLLHPDPQSLALKIDLVRLLNVKYVISKEILDRPFLNFIMAEEGVNLYRLNNSLPRAFILKELNTGIIDMYGRVEVADYRSGSAILKVDMPYEGFLVFSENNYTGWKAYVDEKEVEILPFSLVQAIKLKKGPHIVRFVYIPY